MTKALEGCPSRTYILVQQSGVSSGDYLDSRSAPRLSYHLSGDEDIKTRSVVPEVAGSAESDLEVISEYIQQRCGAEVLRPGMQDWCTPPSGKSLLNGRVAREIPKSADSKRIIHITFPAPSTRDRGTTLDQHGTIVPFSRCHGR